MSWFTAGCPVMPTKSEMRLWVELSDKTEWSDDCFLCEKVIMTGEVRYVRFDALSDLSYAVCASCRPSVIVP